MHSSNQYSARSYKYNQNNQVQNESYSNLTSKSSYAQKSVRAKRRLPHHWPDPSRLQQSRSREEDRHRNYDLQLRPSAEDPRFRRTLSKPKESENSKNCEYNKSHDYKKKDLVKIIETNEGYDTPKILDQKQNHQSNQTLETKSNSSIHQSVQTNLNLNGDPYTWGLNQHLARLKFRSTEGALLKISGVSKNTVILDCPQTKDIMQRILSTVTFILQTLMTNVSNKLPKREWWSYTNITITLILLHILYFLSIHLATAFTYTCTMIQAYYHPEPETFLDKFWNYLHTSYAYIISLPFHLMKMS